MTFTREVLRVLPDGSTRTVRPFHISLEGMKTAIMCKDEEDYDVFVKYIFLSALRKNVIVVSYAVVSNHSHILVLAIDWFTANNYGEDLKRIFGMYYQGKNHECSPLAGNRIQALEIHDARHLRNALAYIPRNAIDNGYNVNEYRWSSYSAYFNSDEKKSGRKIVGMTCREIKRIFRTDMKLKDLPWRIDDSEALVPISACDHRYLEDAFFHDEAFFLKTVGSLNVAEMKETLDNAPKSRLVDSEFRKEAESVCQEWYNARLNDISIDKKIRVITHMVHIRQSSIPQMARVFGLERDRIAEILDHGSRRRRRLTNEQGGTETGEDPKGQSPAGQSPTGQSPTGQSPT